MPAPYLLILAGLFAGAVLVRVVGLAKTAEDDPHQTAHGDSFPITKGD